MLRCELIHDIVLLDICIKLYQNQSIYKIATGMEFFFLKIAAVTLTLVRPTMLKRVPVTDIVILNICWSNLKISSQMKGLELLQHYS